MKMTKKALPTSTICSWENRIDPTPDYQRPPVWSRRQKQLLIDSILREYDVPKMYWRSVDRKGDNIQYEVIDGQQRLRAMWEFKAGKFALAKDTDPVGESSIAGQKYSDLNLDACAIFDNYHVDVVIVDDAVQNEQEDEIRDMFLRLQNGTTLKAQEKRNAMSGNMRDFVKRLALHDFFKNCKFSNSRFTFDHIAAQMMCLELSGNPTSVRDSDLNQMYREHVNFDVDSKVANNIRRVLDYLLRAFPEKTPELERYNVITLYCIASTLLKNFVYEGTEKNLASWFIKFETNRHDQENLDEDKRDIQLAEYRRLISYSTDGEESIKERMNFVVERFLLEIPEISTIDAIRLFTQEQRLAIYRKDRGHCKIRTHCDGDKLRWSDWQADHILPHSKGGTTTVSNGQVSCQACNLAKGNNDLASKIAS